MALVDTVVLKEVRGIVEQAAVEVDAVNVVIGMSVEVLKEVQEIAEQTAAEVDAVNVVTGTSVEVLKEVRGIVVQAAVEVDATNGRGVVVLHHLKSSSKSQWNRMPMVMEQFRKTKLRNGCCVDLTISMPMAMD